MNYQTLVQIVAVIKSLLGFTHRGIIKVENVLGEFDKMIQSLDAAVDTINVAEATNLAIIAKATAENEALAAKRIQANRVSANLTLLTK